MPRTHSAACLSVCACPLTQRRLLGRSCRQLLGCCTHCSSRPGAHPSVSEDTCHSRLIPADCKHCSSPPHLSVHLHLVSHVNEGLAQINANHLTIRASQLKSRPVEFVVFGAGAGSHRQTCRVNTDMQGWAVRQQRRCCRLRGCMAASVSVGAAGPCAKCHPAPADSAAQVQRPPRCRALLGCPAHDQVATLLGEVQPVSKDADLSQEISKGNLQRAKVQGQVPARYMRGQAAGASEYGVKGWLLTPIMPRERSLPTRTQHARD